MESLPKLLPDCIMMVSGFHRLYIISPFFVNSAFVSTSSCGLGITMDKLLCSPKGTKTTWFVNPPVGIQVMFIVFEAYRSQSFLKFFAYRGSKAPQTFLIFMSLYEGNPLKGSHTDDFDRSYGCLG